MTVYAKRGSEFVMYRQVREWKTGARKRGKVKEVEKEVRDGGVCI